MCDLWEIWRLDFAYFREKKKGLKSWWPCRSREIDGDPATRSAKQINKIMQLRTQNIKTVYTFQADYSNTKAPTHSIKLARYSDIC